MTQTADHLDLSHLFDDEKPRTPEAEIKELRAALNRLITLYGHYAQLLNQYDGGSRLSFLDADDWLERLREVAKREASLTAAERGARP